MKRRINQFIVSCLEDLFLSAQGTNQKAAAREIALINILGLLSSTLCVILTLCGGIEPDIGIVVLGPLFGGGFLTAIACSSGGRKNNPKFTLKNFSALILHNLIVDGREERNIEIDAFLEANDPMGSLKIAERKDLFLKMPKFKNFNKENLELWVKEHVGKEKVIVNLFQERVLGTKRERKGLLYWSQLLPKMEKVDDLRFLLLLNPIYEINESLHNFLVISREEVSLAFKSYTSDEIKRLFSSAFALRDYLKVLTIAIKYKITLSVEVDMKELLSWAEEIEAGIKGDEYVFPQDAKWIKSLKSSEFELGSIEAIKNISELSAWATSMRNCIKSYKEKIFAGKSYFFGVVAEGEPYIVFELNSKGELIEAKKKANALLSENETYYLKQFLIKNTRI